MKVKQHGANPQPSPIGRPQDKRNGLQLSAQRANERTSDRRQRRRHAMIFMRSEERELSSHQHAHTHTLRRLLLSSSHVHHRAWGWRIPKVRSRRIRKERRLSGIPDKSGAPDFRFRTPWMDDDRWRSISGTLAHRRATPASNARDVGCCTFWRTLNVSRRSGGSVVPGRY